MSGRAGGDCATAMEVLTQHRVHVFILTSAGKPVYSHHGDPHELAAIFALLQVLVSTTCGSGEKDDELISITSSPSGCSDTYSTTEEASPACPAFYFLRQGELIYICVCTASQSSFYETAMQQQQQQQQRLRRGRAHMAHTLLHRLHRCVVNILPTVQRVLRQSPRYDVRQRHFASAEDRLLHTLIEGHDQSMCGVVDAVPTSALSVPQRRRWTRLLGWHIYRQRCCLCACSRSTSSSCEQNVNLTRCSCDDCQGSDSCDDPARGAGSSSSGRAKDEVGSEGAEEVCMYSYVCRNGCVVAAVSSWHAASAAMAPKRYTADGNTPTDASCSSHGHSSLGSSSSTEAGPPATLAIADVQLLLHLGHVILSRQPGEAWAPVCLPGLNPTGYVWLYAAYLDKQLLDETCPAHGKRRTDCMHVSPSGQWCVIHISASPHSFGVVSRRTRAMARALGSDATQINNRDGTCCSAREAHDGGEGRQASVAGRSVTSDGHAVQQLGADNERCSVLSSSFLAHSSVDWIACVMPGEANRNSEVGTSAHEVRHGVRAVCRLRSVWEGAWPARMEHVRVRQEFYTCVAEARAQLRSFDRTARQSAHGCLPLVMRDFMLENASQGVEHADAGTSMRLTLLALRPTRAVLSVLLTGTEPSPLASVDECHHEAVGVHSQTGVLARGLSTLSQKDERYGQPLHRACQHCIEELYIAFAPDTSEATMMHVAHAALLGILHTRDSYAIEQVCV